MTIFGIILILIGIIDVIWPHIIWKIRHFFTVEGGEPTKLYLTMARVIGVMMILAGVFVLTISESNAAPAYSTEDEIPSGSEAQSTTPSKGGSESQDSTEEYVFYSVEDPHDDAVPNVTIVRSLDNTLYPSIRDYKGLYISDIGEALSTFQKYGFPEEWKEKYDAKWFDQSRLCVVILFTNPSFGHRVTGLDVTQDEITVQIQEIQPRGCFDLGHRKAFVIEVPKSDVPKDAEIKVEIESMFDH